MSTILREQATRERVWLVSKLFVFPSFYMSRRMAGGANRDRTDDLKLAKLALSQLSYGPDLIGLGVSGGPGTS